MVLSSCVPCERVCLVPRWPLSFHFPPFPNCSCLLSTPLSILSKTPSIVRIFEWYKHWHASVSLFCLSYYLSLPPSLDAASFKWSPAAFTPSPTLLLSPSSFSSHLPFPSPPPSPQLTRVQAGASAGGDDDWKSIINSEANLRNYLGEEGFRYCLNKTPEELEKEGDYNIFEKMFGATSNNDARMAARSYGRALTIDVYDEAKAAENKEWIAKYGYKRWGTSVTYIDKSDLETEKKSAPTSVAKKAAPAAAKTTNKPAFSFPKFGGLGGLGGGGGAKAAAAAPAKKSSPVKVTAAKPAAAAAAKPAAAPPAPKAAKAKAAAPPTGPLSGKPQAQGKGNLNLLKNKNV